MKKIISIFFILVLLGSCAVAVDAPTLQEQLDSAAGSVTVPAGTYVLTDTLNIPAGKALILEKGTTLRNLDKPLIHMEEDTTLEGGYLQVRYGPAILIDGNKNHLARPIRIQNVNITGWDWPDVQGTGILLHRKQESPEWSGTGIYSVYVDNVAIGAVEYGLRLFTEKTEGMSDLAVINANVFSNMVFSNNRVAISIERPERECCRVNGNRFSNITIQPQGDRSYLAIYNNGDYNNFSGLMVWDWKYGVVGIHFDALSQYNHIDGTLAYWVFYQDDGAGNVIEQIEYVE